MDDVFDAFLEIIAECATSTIFWVLCPLWMAVVVGLVEVSYYFSTGGWLVPS